MFKSVLLVLFLVVVTSITGFQAFGTSIDFSKCSTAQFHHCMEYLPGQQHNITGAPQNWSFDIFLPDGTCNVSGSMDNQGNCNVSPKILSDKNFTALKNNPFVGSVQNIFSTSSGPIINYCPVALYTLTHQDGYFYKVQNITNLIYPDYCVSETGPNPFPVPEFPQVLSIILAISVFSAIIITTRRSFLQWK